MIWQFFLQKFRKAHKNIRPSSEGGRKWVLTLSLIEALYFIVRRKTQIVNAFDKIRLFSLLGAETSR